MEFGDIDGNQTGIHRLPIPAPLMALMQKKDMRLAEKWLHDNANHPWLQPHRVTMFVQENQFATDLIPVSYFIRCPRFDNDYDEKTPHERQVEAVMQRAEGKEVSMPITPQISANIANSLWVSWEKPPTPPSGIPSPWPDTVDQADIMEIDENDWINYLRDAHKYSKPNTYHCVGPPRFPLYWTCTGMAFLDDQEAHDHEDKTLLDAWAGDPSRDTRGGVVE